MTANKSGGVPFTEHLVAMLGSEKRRRNERSGNVVGKEDDTMEGRFWTHPDQHAVGKGGGVVHLGECRRASAHDSPAHVEHPCTPQGQEGHSEEEAPIPEHANVLKGHRKASDVTDLQTQAQPRQIQTSSHSAWTTLMQCFKGLAVLEFKIARNTLKNGILNQLALDNFQVWAGDKRTDSPLMTCPCVVPSGQDPGHSICLSPRCQRLRSSPMEAKRCQWRGA